MRNYKIWPDDQITISNQKSNQIAILNQQKTIEIIDKVGGLKGNVLDIGNRNYFTEILESKYNLKIDSTNGDLDIEFNCPNKKYDFVHYNNVIEHQFNPLFTLLKIRDILKDDGYLILGCPLKPKWIATNNCHFHEFDKKAYNEIISRSDYKEVTKISFCYIFSIKGIRPFMASFQKRQIISLLIKNDINTIYRDVYRNVFNSTANRIMAQGLAQEAMNKHNKQKFKNINQ